MKMVQITIEIDDTQDAEAIAATVKAAVAATGVPSKAIYITGPMTVEEATDYTEKMVRREQKRARGKG